MVNIYLTQDNKPNEELKYVLDYLGLSVEEFIEMSDNQVISIVKRFADALNDGVMTKSGGKKGKRYKNLTGKENWNVSFGADKGKLTGFSITDTGSKSRYFDIDVWAEKHGIIQIPKASKKEKNKGLEEYKDKNKSQTYIMPKLTCSKCGSKRIDSNNKLVCGCNAGTHYEQQNSKESKNNLAGGNRNNHPTIKPLHLISWLIRLVSKEGDTVLDPFIGSGTTAIAAIKTNRNWIGIEKEKEYVEIAEKRVKNELDQLNLAI